MYVSKWKTQATPIIHFCTELSPSTEITVTIPASCTNRLQKEKTLSRNIIELGISAMALLVIAIYAKHFSDQNEPRVSIRITRIQDNRPIIFLIFLLTFNIFLIKIKKKKKESKRVERHQFSPWEEKKKAREILIEAALGVFFFFHLSWLTSCHQSRG